MLFSSASYAPRAQWRDDFFMGESVPGTPNELLFGCFGMARSAQGAVARTAAFAVSVLIVAVAWTLVR